MNMGKIFLPIHFKMGKFLFIFILLGVTLYAAPIYSFNSMSVNYLDWRKSTEEKTTKRDFSFVKVDGGFGYEWIDFYGYLTLEHPSKSYNDAFPNNQRYVAFVDTDIEMKNSFKLHIQNFYVKSNDFYVNDFVVGFGYKYQNNNGFWIKPFIGVHHTYDTFYKAWNGYMGGWVLDYRFRLFENQFSLFQWNEIEFKRDKKFYEDGGVAIGDGKSYGLNGSLSFWWYLNEIFSTGLEYRYAKNKLGNIGYQDAFVYTLKYGF